MVFVDYLLFGCVGFHFWYWEIERADFFLLKVSLALFLSSYCLVVEFLALSRYSVAGECLLFLAIIV